MRRAAWLTCAERARIRARIREARSVRAWLRAGKPNPEEVRARKARLNTLAEKCGMQRPYPDVDNEPREP